MASPQSSSAPAVPSLRLDGRIHQSLLEHRQIMAALKAKDPGAAALAMHDHILSGRAALAKLHTQG